MASACHCILFLTLLVAGYLCDAADYNILDYGIARKHELWMVKYGRVYKDEAEKARRFEIYKKNIKYIEDFNNAGEHKYTLGEGPFTDLTTEEFLATYTTTSGIEIPEGEMVEGSLRSNKFKTMNPINYTSLPSTPSTVDWRAKGAVTPVRFQANCGACWAFSTAATIESLTQINLGILYDLSVQQIVDCDTSNLGCKGGWPHLAFRYIMKQGGLTTEATYPFAGVDGTCDAMKAAQTVAAIGGYVRVPRNSEQALMAAVAQQPVSVGLHASDDFQHYRHGVFNGYCQNNNITHVVTFVGYDETSSDKYWIVKNSWGDWWGDNGYIKMEKDIASPEGLCGIATYAVYPTP